MAILDLIRCFQGLQGEFAIERDQMGGSGSTGFGFIPDLPLHPEMVRKDDASHGSRSKRLNLRGLAMYCYACRGILDFQLHGDRDRSEMEAGHRPPPPGCFFLFGRFIDDLDVGRSG